MLSLVAPAILKAAALYNLGGEISHHIVGEDILNVLERQPCCSIQIFVIELYSSLLPLVATSRLTQNSLAGHVRLRLLWLFSTWLAT